MADQSDFDAMVDACVDAGRVVMRAGSPDLQAAMRVLLMLLGRELARRTAAAERQTGAGGRGQGAPPLSG